MAHHKSAIKRIRTNEQRRQRNVAARSQVRTMIKKTTAAIEQGAETVPELLRDTVAIIDRAASNGTLHRNTAARKKSRLMRMAAAAGKNTHTD